MIRHRPPPLPSGLVRRPRLLRVLDDAVAHRLVLVVGPPGSGKSTLASVWARALPAHACDWATASPGDEAEALADLVGSVAHERGLLPDQPGREQLADALGAIQAPADGDLFLVVDDAHLIRDPAAARLMVDLVERGPDWFHLVLVSRADPAVPLHRMRVRGHLLEVRDAELRFRRDEVAAFLAGAGEDRLGDEEIDVLTARTEGWPAGVQLATLSLRRRDDPDAFLATFAGTDRHVADYLVHEVLDHQPDHLYWFLLDTSPFDILTPALCEAVTERDDAAKLLEELEREQLFVSRIGFDGEVYRYHELFRELLTFVLRSRHPDREGELLRRAAEWHQSHGDARRAVSEWLGAGALDRAVDAMDEHAATFYDAGMPEVLDAWTRATEELTLAGDAWIVLGHAARLGWAERLDEMALALDRVRDILDQRPDPDAELVHDVLQGFLALAQAELAEARDRFTSAVKVLDDGAREPVAHPRPLYDLVHRAYLGLAMTDAFQVDGVAVRAAVAHARERAPQPPAATMLGRAVLSMAELGDGHLRECDRLTAQVELDARTLRLTDPSYPALRLVRFVGATVLFERDDLDGAAVAFAEQADAGLTPDMPSVLLCSVGLVATLGALGHSDDAMVRLDRIRRRSSRIADPTARGWIDAAEASLLLSLGQVGPSELLAAGLPAEPRHDLLRASIDLAKGDVDAARRRYGSAEPSLRRRLERAVVLAWSDQVDGSPLDADHASTIAELVEGEGMVRTVLAGGPLFVERLLDDASFASTPGGAEVRQRWDARPAAYATSGSDAGLVEQLSDRERQVLRYLTTRLSSREIAAELYVSVNTVKTHIQAIYRKLGCNTRQEAVQRARALRILS